MPLAGLVFRLIKGTPVSSLEGDTNLQKIRDFCNSLEQLIGVSLKTNGTLKDGAVNAASIIADGIISAAKLAADAKVPPGALIDFAGGTVPDGWYLCDGSAKLRSVDAALFAVIGTVHGVGDGSSTFNLPDYRGRTLIGDGTGAGLTARTLGDKLGEETHVLSTTEANLQHQHLVALSSGLTQNDITMQRISARPFTTQITGTDQFGVAGETSASGSIPGNLASGDLVTGDPINTATNVAHQNMQPSAVTKKLIKR